MRISTRKRVSVWFIALFTLSLLSGCDSTPTQPLTVESDAPKVILLVIDALRYDHLGDNGYKHDTAPFLGDLMEQSVSFTQAFSPSNYTGRSVPAIFAGKPMSHIFATQPATFWLPREEDTLAEQFKKAGFDTFLWSSNLHLNMAGFSQGFDEKFCEFTQSRGIISIEGMIREINDRYSSTNRPEFHYIHTMDVHGPYRPPHPFDDLFQESESLYDGVAIQDGYPVSEIGERIPSNLPYYRDTATINRRDIAHLVSLYDGAIRYTDEYLPELLEALDYDPDRDTLIVTADHGEQFYEHGWWEHVKHLYPEETHVPLIIRHPGIKPHSVSGAVGLVDLFPTLCELYDLETPEGLTGKTLMPALEGATRIDGIAYCETPDYGGPSASIITDDHLYYFQANTSSMHPWELWPYAHSLHNLAQDPTCDIDLAPTDTALAREMHETLIETNGRWNVYPWDSIQRPTQPPTLGDNLFSEVTVEHVIEGWNTIEAPDSNTEYVLNRAQPELKATASTPKTGGRHTLTFEYQLMPDENEPGRVEFSLASPNQSEVAWSYNVLYDSFEARTRHLSVIVPSDEVTFSATVIGNRELRLKGLALRTLDVPFVAPGPLPGTLDPGATDSPEESLSEEEIEALEAIGYVD